MVDNSANEIYVSSLSVTTPKNRISWKIEEGKFVAAHVACRREYVVVEDILNDPRFPDGIPYTGKQMNRPI